MKPYSNQGSGRIQVFGVAASSSPEGMRGGRIDWTTVAQTTLATELPDDNAIEPGERYLRFGAILVRIDVGESQGMFGPYDRDATDGRQLLQRGNAFVLNRTVQGSESSATPELFEGGSVFKARLLVSDEGGPNQPSWDDFNAAFPQIRLISD